MVYNLEKRFSSTKADITTPQEITIDIPAASDEFWMVKFNPKFPTAALRKGRTGSATIKFDINTKGKLENIEVLDVSNSLFRRAAISHAEDMIYVRYAKTVDNYIAENVIYEINFIFEN